MIEQMNLTYSLPYDRISQGGQRYTNSRPRLRTVPFRGLLLNIEIEKGETKSGIGEDGKSWSHVYEFLYGEIANTTALSDGDPVDVYLGTDTMAPMVFIVHQVRLDGTPDEDKVFLAFSSESDAIAAYKAHGPQWGLGSVDSMSWQEFKNGYLAANRKF